MSSELEGAPKFSDEAFKNARHVSLDAIPEIPAGIGAGDFGLLRVDIKDPNVSYHIAFQRIGPSTIRLWRYTNRLVVSTEVRHLGPKP